MPEVFTVFLVSLKVLFFIPVISLPFVVGELYDLSGVLQYI